MKRRRQTREVNYIQPVKQEMRQTIRVGGSFKDRLIVCYLAHIQALLDSLLRLAESRFNSIMTIAVLSITISLASGFQLLVNNLKQFNVSLQDSSQISLFLKDGVSEARANKVAEEIRHNDAIQQVNIISKEQGLKEFKTYSGFGDAINVLKSNPLPIVIQVFPKSNLDKDQLENLVQEFQQSVDIDLAQMDMLWVERLQSMMAVANDSLHLLDTLLGIAVLFIAGNTIRLEMQTRRDEIIIAKLVGATDGFIQRPFLYTGFWMGFIAGIVAWFTVTVMMAILWQSVEPLAQLYGGEFHLIFFGFLDTFKLIFLSAALGVFGSWLVLCYQLRYTIPE